jgi:hypothetical protein
LISIPLFGGLGNQLFGYAFAAYQRNLMSAPVDCEVMVMRPSRGNKTHGQSLLDEFSLDIPLNFHRESKLDHLVLGILRFLRLRLGYRTVFSNMTLALSAEEAFQIQNDVSIGTRVFVSNYFRTPEYLLQLQNIGHMKFLIPAKQSINYTKLITNENLSDDVFVVHMRRGDYLRPSINEALPLGYYVNALQALGATSSSKIFVVSDSSELAKREFETSDFRDLVFVGGSDLPLSPAESLSFASQAQNLVMSNSTFSWWAAMTGNLEKSVIYPEGWNSYLMKNSWQSVNSG